MLRFWTALPNNHILSGMAEMIKHGFISSENYLNESFRFNLKNTQQVGSVDLSRLFSKIVIITKDPNEKGLPENSKFWSYFGAHAIESYFLRQSGINSLLHGEAIAIGMVLELYISHELLHFPLKNSHFTPRKYWGFSQNNPLLKGCGRDYQIVKFRQKNRGGKVLFVLLEDIGQFQWNLEVSITWLKRPLNFTKIL